MRRRKRLSKAPHRQTSGSNQAYAGELENVSGRKSSRSIRNDLRGRLTSRPSVRTMRALAGLAVVPICISTLLAGATPAGADQISDKTAQAAKLTDQLEASADKLESLGEDLSDAQGEVTDLAHKVTDMESALVVTDGQAASMQVQVKAQAIDAYVRGSDELIAPNASMQDVTDIDTAKLYSETLLSGSNDALDQLHAIRLSQDEQRNELSAAKTKADTAAASVKRKYEQVQQTKAEQAALLKQTQGELATLVAQEQQRRAAAAAQAAQAALAARKAAASARSTSISTPSGAKAPAPNSRAAAAVEAARDQLGKPYDFGSDGPGSFDCSGLTAWAWDAAGVGLPHSSRAQYTVTTHIDVDDIQPGDILFYGRPIHHVGIYAGGGQMIEAPHTGAVVRYSSIFRRDLVGVGRVN